MAGRDVQQSPPEQPAEPPQPPASANVEADRHIADLERRAEALMVRVAELEAANRVLSDTLFETEQTCRTKSLLLSRMSHELRSPLNAILGFSELLVGSDCHESDVVRFGRHIHEAGEDLLRLIEAVVDVMRVESGREQVAREAVPVGEVLVRARLSTGRLAEEAGVGVNVQPGPGDTALVVADASRVGQIVNHLVVNAIRFNHTGGRVDISSEIVGANLRIRVDDSGPGLPPEQVARLFMPFERLEAGKRNIPGAGLGLYLSRILATAMRGAMGVETTPDKRNRFWVELPLYVPPPACET